MEKVNVQQYSNNRSIERCSQWVDPINNKLTYVYIFIDVGK